MNIEQSPQEYLVFQNMWRKNEPEIQREVSEIWRQSGLQNEEIEKRLTQLVYVVRNTTNGHVVGISTAFKTFIKQLHNHLYAFRCMLVPRYRIPGLTSKLLVMTRDFLESIHEHDGSEKAIGVITIVENDRIKQHRTEAVWPASGMVYIGDTKNGNPIRVYYFKGARIK